jgi:hypothetical protein
MADDCDPQASEFSVCRWIAKTEEFLQNKINTKTFMFILVHR